MKSLVLHGLPPTHTTSGRPTLAPLRDKPSPKRTAPNSQSVSSNKQRNIMGGGNVNTAPKRAWKLQENAAHQGSVNCLTLGHRSGRVMATGGDDKRVNLWAIGKAGCIMSLSGHVTPVECVRFGQTEELVCAGSLSGAIKLWDLEAAKLVRTLAGHRAMVRCLDFHPYGDFVASGSHDSNIKLWDVRRRGCIFSYKGHERAVNSVQFSPDGQWVASGSDDYTVRLWDLRAGKELTSFSGHSSSVRTVVFHPQEFLLCSGSVDRRVMFWDLECLENVSVAGGSGDSGSGAVRSLAFNPSGECVFAGVQDSLKVYGWEPGRTLDTVVLNWGKVADIVVTQNQLIGASFQSSDVAVYVVDLKRVLPISDNGKSDKEEITVSSSVGESSSTAVKANGTGKINPPKKPESNHRAPTIASAARSSGSPQKQKPGRKSFASKEEKAPVSIMVEEPDTDPGPTDVEDESCSPAQILNTAQYSLIFQPRGRVLSRTPPPEQKPFTPPSDHGSNIVSSDILPIGGFPAQRPQDSTNSSKSIFDSLPHSRRRESLSGGSSTSSSSSSSTLPRHPPILANGGSSYLSSKNVRSRSESRKRLQQSSYHHHTPGYYTSSLEIPSKDVSDNEGNGKYLRSLSRHHPFAMQQSFPLVHSASFSLLNQPNNSMPPPFAPVEDIFPESTASLNPDHFLPRPPRRSTSFSGPGTASSHLVVDMSESEVISQLINGHQSMLKVVSLRHKAVQVIHNLWHKRDPKTAVEYAVGLAERGDQTVLVDFLSVLVPQENVWSLDICLLLLPLLSQLLRSPYEEYVSTSGRALKVILKNFVPVIRSNMSGPVNVGVGVDLSREDRRRKSMLCYENLVTVRAFVLKRQTLQGAVGHLFRELGTLVQSLD